jgi:hypothetical protein
VAPSNFFEVSLTGTHQKNPVQNVAPRLKRKEKQSGECGLKRKEKQRH